MAGQLPKIQPQQAVDWCAEYAIVLVQFSLLVVASPQGRVGAYGGASGSLPRQTHSVAIQVGMPMTEFYKDMEMVYKPSLIKLRRDLHEIQCDMARILQTCCDADEAPAIELLNQVTEIARKHPWPQDEVDGTEEHQQTDRCGFDRDSSHSCGTYVCTCGWIETGTAPSNGVANESSLNAVSDDYGLVEVQVRR